MPPNAPPCLVARASIQEDLATIVGHRARNLTAILITILDDVKEYLLRPDDSLPDKNIRRARQSALELLALVESELHWPACESIKIHDVLQDVARLVPVYRNTRLQVESPNANVGRIAATHSDVKAAVLLMVLYGFRSLPDGGVVSLSARNEVDGIVVTSSIQSNKIEKENSLQIRSAHAAALTELATALGWKSNERSSAEYRATASPDSTGPALGGCPDSQCTTRQAPEIPCVVAPRLHRSTPNQNISKSLFWLKVVDSKSWLRAMRPHRASPG